MERSKADAPGATGEVGEVVDDNNSSSKAQSDEDGDDGAVVVMEKLCGARMRRSVSGEMRGGLLIAVLADDRLRGPSYISLTPQALKVLKARARGLGSGLQNPRAEPWARQSRHQGSAGLRLLGLGCPGFRALSRAVHITSQWSMLSLIILPSPQRVYTLTESRLQSGLTIVLSTTAFVFGMCTIILPCISMNT